MATKVAKESTKLKRRRRRGLLKKTLQRQANQTRASIIPKHIAHPESSGVPLHKLIGKGGRELAFKTPLVLAEKCQDYFNYIDDNPWYKIDFKGPRLKRVDVPCAVPYSLEGLLVYLGVSSAFWRNFRNGLSEKKTLSKNEKDGFCSVLESVEHVIRTRKFNGGAVGVFNSRLMAFDLGYIKRENEMGENVGTSLNIIVEKAEYQNLIEDIKEQLQKIDNDEKAANGK